MTSHEPRPREAERAEGVEVEAVAAARIEIAPDSEKPSVTRGDRRLASNCISQWCVTSTMSRIAVKTRVPAAMPSRATW